MFQRIFGYGGLEIVLFRNLVQSLKCPVLRIDGTKPIEENVDFIMEKIQNVRGINEGK